jgi:hypothetical protein
MSIYAYLPIIALPPSAQIAQDEYAVDAWQLGVLAFFLLTGWMIPGLSMGKPGVSRWHENHHFPMVSMGLFQLDLDFFIGVSGYGVFNGVTYTYLYIYICLVGQLVISNLM